MNKRMFAEKLKRVTVGKKDKARVDVALIATVLTPAECTQIVHFLIRHRAPILTAFIEHADETLDPSMITGCGYLCHTVGREGYRFTHTSEHQIKQ